MNKIASIFLILIFLISITVGFLWFISGVEHNHALCPAIFIHGSICSEENGLLGIVSHLEVLKHFLESAYGRIFSQFLLFFAPLFLFGVIDIAGGPPSRRPFSFFRRRQKEWRQDKKDILYWLSFLINSPPVVR